MHRGHIARPNWLMALVLMVATVTTGTIAFAMVGRVDQGATAQRFAERAPIVVGDVVSVYDVGTVDSFVVTGSATAAAAAGGVSVPARTGALGLSALTRDGAKVGGPPAGYLIPIVFSAIPEMAIGWVLGANVAGHTGPSTIVMNEGTAAQIGAQAGDVVELVGLDGQKVRLTIGAILPASEIGSTELVMTTDVADLLGQSADTRTIIWGFSDRDQIDQALDDYGLEGRPDTRIARSWDAPQPDWTLSTMQAKELVGTPWYRRDGNGAISMHPTFTENHLTDGLVLLNNDIPISARCNLAVVDDLRAALADVAAAGLASAIDVQNTNRYGGCYNPRYSRSSGFLSRHAYGMAFDMNTLTNCISCRPVMDCTVVQIFRRHGFAWGGNFRVPDGMHFEWVGERRDLVEYPSTYCPNTGLTGPDPGGVDGADGSAGDVDDLQRQVGIDAALVVDESNHDHDHADGDNHG